MVESKIQITLTNLIDNTNGKQQFMQNLKNFAKNFAFKEL